MLHIGARVVDNGPCFDLVERTGVIECMYRDFAVVALDKPITHGSPGDPDSATIGRLVYHTSNLRRA